MESARRTAVLSLAFLLLWAAGAAVVHAQESESSQQIREELSVESSDEKAQELLTRIRSDLDDLQRYAVRMESAGTEDSLVLQGQIADRRVRALENLHALADLLVKLEESEPRPELRPRIEAVFFSLNPRLPEFTDRLRAHIDELRSQRPGISDEERLALEDRIERRTEFLDSIYSLWEAHLKKLELLGMDSKEPSQWFTDALQSRADELSGRIRLALERVDEYSSLLADSPDDNAIQTRLLAAKKSLDTNAESLQSTLDLMEAQGLEVSEYRTQLVAATRDITTGLLDSGVAVSLLSRWWSSLKDWLVESGPRFLVKLLVFVVILFAFRLLARLARRAVKRGLASSKLQLSQLLSRMIINTAGNLVMFLGLMVALSQLGVSLGPLMAGLGVAGFILGFALQDSLSNFAAGMMILIYRPYDVGDLVDISGVFGKVERMSLVSTTILTIDNQTLVVPNSKIWGDVIKNVTAQRIRRVDMTFGISYQDDIPKAEKVFEGILESHPKVLEDPPPVVRLHNLGDSSVDFVVRPWVKTEDYWDVYWDVTRSVKLRLDEAEISIPFPQRDVHIYEEVLAERAGGTPATLVQETTARSSQSALESPSDDDSAS